MSFVHLRVHSDYSLSDGLCRVKKLPGWVADRGMPAVALTDQSNLFAMVKFYRGCLSAVFSPSWVQMCGGVIASKLQRRSRYWSKTSRAISSCPSG